MSVMAEATSELVRKLRDAPSITTTAPWTVGARCLEAADKIVCMSYEIARLKAELAEAIEQRDIAVRGIKDFLKP